MIPLTMFAASEADFVGIKYYITTINTSWGLRDAGSVNYTVDWGDGNTQASTSNNLSHTYASAGSYVVTVTPTGTYRPYWNSTAHGWYITACEISTDSTWNLGTSLDDAFERAGNMTTITMNLSATSNVTSLHRAWEDCYDLTSFPLIDTSSVTNFGEAWENNRDLTSFPSLDTSSGTNFYNAWYYCNSLTSFPVLDTSNGTNFTSAWRSCSSLTSFPLLDTSSVTSFYAAWRNCTGLTSFPLLDTSSATSFVNAWYSCQSLTSFPSIDTSSGTNFNSAWIYCYDLTSFPANVFDSTGGLSSSAFFRAWYNCALTAQSIENILTSLDTNGASNITLGIDSGSNASKTTWSTAANTAYTNLINKGWTISYNS